MSDLSRCGLCGKKKKNMGMVRVNYFKTGLQYVPLKLFCGRCGKALKKCPEIFLKESFKDLISIPLSKVGNNHAV